MFCSVRREKVLYSLPVFDRVARVQQRHAHGTVRSGDAMAHSGVTTAREAPRRRTVADVQGPVVKCRTEVAAATAELLARLRRVLIESSKPLGRGHAAVGHAAAVRRIEVPMIVGEVRPVEIVVAGDMDVDIVAAPVEAAPQREACGDANAPEKSIDHKGAALRPPVDRIVKRGTWAT